MRIALPNSAAIEMHGQRLDHSAIWMRASAIARQLQLTPGFQEGARVGLLLEPSLDTIPAILGIWMAGGTYVPLDPNFPDNRLAYIVRHADIRLVVIQPAQRITLGLLATQLNRQLHAIRTDQLPLQAPLLPLAVDPAQAAYLIYTSGSTGEPKGVAVPFRGLLNLAEGIRPILGLSPTTRYLQFASLSFDASVWEMFPTLLAGGTIVHGTREDMMPGRRLAQYIRRVEATHLCLPPSVLAKITAFEPELACVRNVVMAGERCPAPLVEAWQKAGRAVFNAYGPTEASVCATIHAVAGGEDPVPIGRALPNVSIRLADAEGRAVPQGQAGEIWIGGTGLALGYWNQPDLTNAKFPVVGGIRYYRTGDEAVQLSDGSYHFLGRIDQQVKLRGFRIELEAIENLMYAYPGVAQAAVKLFEVADEQGAATGFLVGYYSQTDGAAAITAEGLRQHLAQHLPDYMVPHHLVALPSLPLMPNLSKVDRKALQLPAELASKAAVAQTPAPQTDRSASPLDKLCAIFAQALNGTTEVTPETHFFRAGGDSLGVAQVLYQIEETFGANLPSRVVYSNPTPASLLPFCEDGAQLPDPEGDTEQLLADSFFHPKAPAAEVGPALPQTIFLTGATGFLGIHVLLELVAFGVPKVYCLVRAKTEAEAFERLLQTSRKYGLSDFARYYQAIVAVPGDITLPNLGLSAETYAQLSTTCDAVVHAAANISYILPYTQAGKPNADGTRALLDFAFEGRRKAFHHISSLSVYGASATLLDLPVVDEDFDLDSSLPVMAHENGYTRAKWVAEKMVGYAKAAGLPVSIYRPGFIEGHSLTGHANRDDLFCRYLLGNIQMGIYPDFPNKYWLTVPVDFVAAAVAYLVLQVPPGANYNLLPERPAEPSNNELFAQITAWGVPLRRVKPAEWLQELANLTPDNALFPLVGFLREKVYRNSRTVLEMHHTSSVVDCRKTLAALAPSGIEPPHIDEALLRTYLRFLGVLQTQRVLQPEGARESAPLLLTH